MGFIFCTMMALFLCICRKKAKKDTDEIMETVPETEGATLQMHVVSALPEKTTTMENNFSTQSEDDSLYHHDPDPDVTAGGDIQSQNTLQRMKTGFIFFCECYL